ncbi:MAG: 30S ribosomal protein S12 methylthiotransferase RimO [Bacteroidales bacterium]|nr:30S ribosomal protein S12 methylthiotransferase RimO [Bacteroidales bacterium]
MTGKKSVKIITLGCSKNTVDSEKLLKQLSYSGFGESPDSTGNPDIVIVNTCGFINDAKEESVNKIIELVDAKEKGMIGELYVMGCLSERYKDELEKEIPGVDRYFGVNKPGEILRYLNSDYSKPLEADRVLSGPGHYAYLKVSEGCNRQCAFCAIPGIRGNYLSAPVERLVKETYTLTKKGVKELILIAQDLSYYGVDRYRKPMLVELVEKLLENGDIEWLRLHYLYPGSIPDKLIDLMKSDPRICNYIDIPIQHISDNVLSSMNRGHSGKYTRELLYSLRKQIPEAAIRTTLLTGFPGETEQDFDELSAFVKEFRFERMGVFTYSHEEDTPAYSKKDDVPDRIKQERADHLMEIQQDISMENNKQLVGKKMRVIADSIENKNCIARTEFDSPEVDQEIIIPGGEKLQPGKYYDVLITVAGLYDLEAKII